MSSTIQLPPRTKYALMPFAIAILIALSIGAAAGSLATRAAVGRDHPVATASGWDVQKLQAMEGRQLAEAIRMNRSAR